MGGGILAAIEDALDERGLTIKEVAPLVGKEYSTLKRELNEYDSGAKLGVETLIPLIRTVGPAPLEFIAAACGYRIVPVTGDPVQAETAYPCLASAMSAAGDLANRLRVAADQTGGVQ